METIVFKNTIYKNELMPSKLKFLHSIVKSNDVNGTIIRVENIHIIENGIYTIEQIISMVNNKK